MRDLIAMQKEFEEQTSGRTEHEGFLIEKATHSMFQITHLDPKKPTPKPLAGMWTSMEDAKTAINAHLGNTAATLQRTEGPSA